MLKEIILLLKITITIKVTYVLINILRQINFEFDICMIMSYDNMNPNL